MKKIGELLNIDKEGLGGSGRTLAIQEQASVTEFDVFDQAANNPAPICPMCHDRGIVISGDVAKPCTCMQKKKIENRFRNARISRNLLNCQLESFNVAYYASADGRDQQHLQRANKALNAAEEFVNKYKHAECGEGLLLTGEVGSGKTFLAAAIANALIKSGRQVLFLIVPDLLDELKATFNKAAELTELDLLDTARTVPVLILDDLGAHNYTEWTKNRLYSIINYRLNELLPTVVTSNLTLFEMEEYLGQRTTSRLMQMCRVFRLTRETDIRLKKYEERENIR